MVILMVQTGGTMIKNPYKGNQGKIIVADNNQKYEKKDNILLVDDTVDNLRFLSNMLSKQGYEVRKALNGKTALMAVQAAPPDLILLDIMMPEMDGYEVCTQLKALEKTRDIPVIFLSALDDVLNKVKAFNVGGADYISKPFQFEEVLARIESQLTAQRLQKQLGEQNAILQREIEERKLVEAALRSSEAKNRALVDAIPDVMFRINADGIFLDYRGAKFDRFSTTEFEDEKLTKPFCSSHSSDLPYGQTPRDRQAIGKSVSEIFSEDLAGWTMHYVEETLSTRTMQIGEYVQQVNGQWHHYEARYVVSGADEVLAILRDISDQKRAEAQMRQSEAQLKAQKTQLTETLNELKRTQATLIQNEKMIGLGQLVAGIAHEINNPIGFIYGNLSYVSSYTSDLLKLVKMYQEALPNSTTDIQQVIEDIDLEFLDEDLPKLIGSINAGAERISKIVLSLQNFSRLGEAELKRVDLHEGIESTLMILQHRLKGNSNRPAIAVVKEFGSLPLVECYAGKINQVFMNILSNAIDSLESRFANDAIEKSFVIDNSSLLESTKLLTNDNPTITIHTELVDTQLVAIAITDNGQGMTEAVRKRVFDPFFTTKEVGSGTGLGMSISYQVVVEQHRGEIRCESATGEGAKFTVAIPIVHPKELQTRLTH